MQQSAQMKIEHREKEAQELRQAMFYLTVIIFRLDKTHNKPHKQKGLISVFGLHLFSQSILYPCICFVPLTANIILFLI